MAREALRGCAGVRSDPGCGEHTVSNVVDGPVSAEVVATDFDGMVKQAHELHAVHPNIVVKVPPGPYPRQGERACSTLPVHEVFPLKFAKNVLEVVKTLYPFVQL